MERSSTYRASRIARIRSDNLTLRHAEVGALIVYALLAFVPPIFMVLLGASSYAAGLLIASVLTMPFLVRGLPSLRVEWTIVIAATLIATWGAIPLVLNDAVPFGKIVSSSAAMGWLLFVAVMLRDAFGRLREDEVRKVMAWMALPLIVSAGLAATLDFTPFTYAADYGRPVFPFREPSHFALVAGPLFGTLAVVSGRNIKVLLVMTCLGLAVLFPSASMAVYALLIAALVFPIRGWLLLVGGAALVLFAIGSIDVAYFTRRVDVGAESRSMTAFMWLQGYEDAVMSFRSTGGVGAGFQSMGYGPRGPVSSRVLEMFRFVMNREAGGFMAAKLVGELGVLGLGLVAWIVKMMVTSGWKIRRALRAGDSGVALSNNTLAAHAFIALFGVEMFIRAGGYFSPSFLLFIAAVLYVKRRARSSETSPGLVPATS